MWLVFLLLFLLFGIIFLKIKVEILKFFLDKNDFKLLLNIKFNIFGFWPIFTIKCNNNGIFIFKNKIVYKKFFKKIDLTNITKKIRPNEIIKSLREVKVRINNIDFMLIVGTGNVFVTSTFVVLLSTVLVNGLRNKTMKKIRFKVLPNYKKIVIDYNGKTIISVKLIDVLKHIIKVKSLNNYKNKHNKRDKKPKILSIET